MKALENSQLWFAKIDTLNDDEEFSWALDKNVSNAEWVNLLCEYYQRRLARSNTPVQLDDMIKTVIRMQQPGVEIKDIPQIFLNAIDSLFQDIKNSTGVCSMAMADEQYIYPYPLTNPKLWKEYSKHTESIPNPHCYCLEYDGIALKTFFDSAENDKFSHNRVEYSDNNTVLITIRDYQDKLKSEEDIKLYNKIRNAASVKTTQWSYEVEYRFFSRGVGLYSFPIDALKTIYVPYTPNKNTREHLFDILNYTYPKVQKVEVLIENQSVGFKVL